MVKGLKRFLLVDDSKATNFFNKTVIERSGVPAEILIAENGEEALNVVTSEQSPDIIFLDINMPVMNGWNFISEYQQLENKYKKGIIILMLGTTLSIEDEEKANNTPEIKEFREKMLTKEIVEDIVSNYF
ncbi:two-component system response regulator [Aquimarina hainanensis]|uniref:Two-component system response regulator n=1 Tax=Aquimarina hainanensis TaxID=1578017 RepID=A0ABW5NED4_9FLAO|nr:response regulator [Aquimarina sp. TRL1]QKX07270.1 response regulator [Aquimarina sp. TRL1]